MSMLDMSDYDETHGPNEKGVRNLTVYSSDEGEDEGVDDPSLIDLQLQPGALESSYSRLRA
jgi:hypothetical protein